MKKLLFNRILLPSVFDGTKTRTRRAISIKPVSYCAECLTPITELGCECGDYPEMSIEQILETAKPKHKVGEVVYIPEPYAQECIEQQTEQGIERIATGNFLYKLNGDELSSDDKNSPFGKWKNMFFMPESAARFFAIVKEVKLTRQQDISDEECMQEGIYSLLNSPHKHGRTVYLNHIVNKKGVPKMYDTPKEAFAALIDFTSGGGTWERNPFVWAYVFELSCCGNCINFDNEDTDGNGYCSANHCTMYCDCCCCIHKFKTT